MVTCYEVLTISKCYPQLNIYALCLHLIMVSVGDLIFLKKDHLGSALVIIPEEIVYHPISYLYTCTVYSRT